MIFVRCFTFPVRKRAKKERRTRSFPFLIHFGNTLIIREELLDSCTDDGSLRGSAVGAFRLNASAVPFGRYAVKAPQAFRLYSLSTDEEVCVLRILSAVVRIPLLDTAVSLEIEE